VLALAAALLVLLAAVIAGCGGGGDDGKSGSSTSSPNGAASTIEEFGSPLEGAEAEQLEADLHGYLDARAAGEWAKACKGLAKPSQKVLSRLAKRSKTIEGDGCAAAMQSITEQRSPSERGDLAEADVESVRREGSRAYVIYSGAKDAKYAMPATHEGGRWGFSVSAVPLG
jgi:hypothetical protein